MDKLEIILFAILFLTDAALFYLLDIQKRINSELIKSIIYLTALTVGKEETKKEEEKK